MTPSYDIVIPKHKKVNSNVVSRLPPKPVYKPRELSLFEKIDNVVQASTLILSAVDILNKTFNSKKH